MVQLFTGEFYPNGTGRPLPATVAWADEALLSITVADEAARYWNIRDRAFTWERSADALRLAQGTPPEVLVVRDPEAIAHWPRHFAQRGKKERQVATWPWLLRVPLMLPLGFIALCAFLYFVVLPWGAARVVDKLPHSVDLQLGDAVAKGMLQGMPIDTARSAALQRFGDALVLAPSFPLTYYVAEDTVVNAFAMPGGRIVVYTGLLERMDRPEQLVALLAHEATHVEQRHSTRSIVRKLSGVAFLAVVFGEASGLVAAAAERADDLKGLHYSRSLEVEADTVGIHRMLENGVDPAGMLQLLALLQDGTEGASAVPEFLSSHPDTEERKRVAQALIDRSALPAGQDPAALSLLFEALRVPGAL